MKRMLAITLTALLFAQPAVAETFRHASLFFTPDETTLIKNGGKNAAAPHAVTLEAISYSSASRWTVWMDRRQWSPQNKDRDENINIIYVSADEVTFEWRAQPDAPARRVTLLSGQAYDPENDIVIGKNDR
ncbi:MAG: hypothetical protein GC131_04925 [Alphaproteobacteria bacterium]|nr:hypothetical protein [Alphaproteobacteria bacterium]